MREKCRGKPTEIARYGDREREREQRGRREWTSMRQENLERCAKDPLYEGMLKGFSFSKCIMPLKRQPASVEDSEFTSLFLPLMVSGMRRC